MNTAIRSYLEAVALQPMHKDCTAVIKTSLGNTEIRGPLRLLKDGRFAIAAHKKCNAALATGWNVYARRFTILIPLTEIVFEADAWPEANRRAVFAVEFDVETRTGRSEGVYVW